MSDMSEQAYLSRMIEYGFTVFEDGRIKDNQTGCVYLLLGHRTRRQIIKHMLVKRILQTANKTGA